MKNNPPSRSTDWTRREFLRTSIATAGSAAVVGGLPLQALAGIGEPEKPRVIKITSPRVLAEPSVTAAVDRKTVREMLEAGLTRLTGQKTLRDALGTLVGKDDVVGLKINCLGRQHLSTHAAIPELLAEALQALGIPADAIYIFDRYQNHLKLAGYTLAEEPGHVQCVGFERAMDPEATFTTADGSYTTNWPKLLTRRLTRIINLPVMKNHGGSGVTFALKNLAFGLVHPTKGPCHNNHCDPFIAEVCAEKRIQDRVVLHILDGLVCGFDGGPAQCTRDKRAVHESLYFALDPVAMDAVVRQELNAVRKQHDLREISLDHARHIETAARRGLGTADRHKIAVVTAAI
ncbi:MAG: DUF362 domain-containing protein [Planctomycetes bacterium]|nr:DUF362 domain-containing protein [Planctomycetota bacterium]